MTTFLYILLAIVVLLVLITVHEFGHYIAGKIFGFKINEFSIGFGPAIYKKTKKDGELFAIRALPLGGYCAFEGEDEEGKDRPGAFNTQPAWKRLIVLLSGVTFNFLFGILTAAIYLLVCGYATTQIAVPVKTKTTECMGFEKGDIIIAADGKTIEAYRSYSSIISKIDNDKEFTVTVNRDGQIIDIVTKKQKFPAYYYIPNYDDFKDKLFKNVDGEGVAVTIETFEENLLKCEDKDELKAYLQTIYSSSELAKANDSTKSYAKDIDALITKNDDLGYAKIAMSKSGYGTGIIQTSAEQKYSFFESIGRAWPFSFYLCSTILSALGGLFTGATALSEMGGTVTAVSQIAEISQMGINYFLLLLPLLSMNLALFNVLPIPSLDGARAVFVLIEMIFKKPVPRKIEGWIHTIGLFLLLGLVVFFDIYHFAISARLLI